MLLISDYIFKCMLETELNVLNINTQFVFCKMEKNWWLLEIKQFK